MEQQKTSLRDEIREWLEDGALDKAKIAAWKARIERNKAQIARNEKEIARLKLEIVKLAKDCKEVNALLYDAEGMKDKTFFLLHKLSVGKEVMWGLSEVGKRRDGTTWLECQASYASLEEAKLKLAVEGKTARVLKEDWREEAHNFRIGIGIFSYEQLCTVASDPL